MRPTDRRHPAGTYDVHHILVDGAPWCQHRAHTPFIPCDYNWRLPAIQAAERVAKLTKSADVAITPGNCCCAQKVARP